MGDVTKITVNGREYDGVEQMPPDVREEYLLAIAAMSGASTGDTSGVVKKSNLSHSVVQESFIHNGHEYKSRDELPPDVREVIDKMPELSLGDKRTELIIKTTTRTIPPKPQMFDELAGNEGKSPEEEPVVAWLLVKILVAIVLILFFLLFVLSLKSNR